MPDRAIQKSDLLICINNSDYPASLVREKVYQSLSDSKVEAEGFVRVIDESGEDYLYPASLFARATPPDETRSPNKTTIKAMNEIESGHGESFSSDEELFRHLKI